MESCVDGERGLRENSQLVSKSIESKTQLTKNCLIHLLLLTLEGRDDLVDNTTKETTKK
jgi:hypothetical protein